MPFDGNGKFNRLHSWSVDAAQGIDIRSDKMDNEMNGMATALSDCMTRDGQAPPLNNLPMGGFILTGLGPGTAAGNSVTWDQVFLSAAFTTPTAVATPPIGDSSLLLATTAFVAETAFSAILPGQAGASGKVLGSNGTVASWVLAGMSKTFLDGLLCSYASGTTITVAAGLANDDSGTVQPPNIVLATALTKAVFTAFAAGAAGGASDGTVQATGWNYLWVISGTAGVDVLASASATAPTLPTGYTVKRRVGAFYASSSAVLQFVQRGSYFYLTVQLTEGINVAVASAGSTAPTTAITHVPPGMIGLLSMYMNVVTGSTQTGMTLYNADETVPTMTSTTGFDFLPSGTGTSTLPTGYVERRVTSGGLLKWGLWNFSGTTPFNIAAETTVHGWKDERGVGQS